MDGQARLGNASAESSNLTRRKLLSRLALAGFSAPVIASIATSKAFAQDATPEATPSPEEVLAKLGLDDRLIPFGTTNFGTPLELVDGLIVPNDLFFVRTHGAVDFAIEPADWKLSVTGLVEMPVELGLEDLQALPQRTITAFLECSGDSRSRFDPKAEGSQWGDNAIGNAEWIGTSLSNVLGLAGIKEGAVDVVSQGGDFAEMQRGLSLDKALDPDTLLVWSMNGEPLPAPHGGPVRLFVPGWGGIASTKWIVGLDVIDHHFAGHFNSEVYVIVDEGGYGIRPVTTMPVKSVITSPSAGATLPSGSVAIAGYAWSGYGGITKVEVSADGGTTWSEAPIVLEAGPLSWVRFEYPWQATTGTALLRSRAYDERGLTQPDSVPWNANGYQMNAVEEVAISIG